MVLYFLAVLAHPLETGDPFVDELRCGRVVADDDEYGRHGNAGLLPGFVSLLVVAIERIKRRLQLGRDRERIEFPRLARTLPRHFLADVFPQVAVDWHVAD